jgi:hypothetical protein
MVVVAIAALIGLSLISASGRSGLSGSTYSRTPAGYGAWYAAIRQDCDVNIRRWQRPLVDLPGFAESPPGDSVSPIVLVRLYGEFQSQLPGLPDDWLNRGNVVIHVGVRSPATLAPFTHQVRTNLGTVTIETRRRAASESGDDIRDHPFIPLQDEYGMLIWEKRTEGGGREVFVGPPHLAANAYQQNLNNFDLLTQLVTEPGLPILIDEYIHGHRDTDTATSPEINEPVTRCPPPPELEGFSADQLPEPEPPPTLIGYLANTPLLVLTVQAIALLLLLIWGQNRRFGPPQTVQPPSVDNSDAYITALSAILYKAGCHRFVVDLLTQAEKRHIQRSLGLGSSPVSSEAIAQTWTSTTRQPPDDVLTVLNLVQTPTIRQDDLIRWLNAMQRVRQHLPNLHP